MNSVDTKVSNGVKPYLFNACVRIKVLGHAKCLGLFSKFDPLSPVKAGTSVPNRYFLPEWVIPFLALNGSWTNRELRNKNEVGPDAPSAEGSMLEAECGENGTLNKYRTGYPRNLSEVTLPLLIGEGGEGGFCLLQAFPFGAARSHRKVKRLLV